MMSSKQLFKLVGLLAILGVMLLVKGQTTPVTYAVGDPAWQADPLDLAKTIIIYGSGTTPISMGYTNKGTETWNIGEVVSINYRYVDGDYDGAGDEANQNGNSSFNCPDWVSSSRPIYVITKAAPGQNGYFNFDFCNWQNLPPGTYRETFELMHDDVWFYTDVPAKRVTVTIIVKEAPTPTPFPTPAPTATPGPGGGCAVPFYSQIDPNWRNHPLRTAGVCSAYCGTIGTCGCTLTSAAMVFTYYGATSMNPPNLSDCMGTSACPFYWGIGAGCTAGRATWVNRYEFSWGELEQQINQSGGRPVILGMQHYSSGLTHWIVVLSGSGSDPANYLIHDPAFTGGANMRLNSRSAEWGFEYIAVYSGTPLCTAEAVASNELDPLALSPKPLELTLGTGVVEQATDPANVNIAATSVISGAVWVYRMTNLTMTIELTADATVGHVTEALIWSDTISNTTWQAFTPYIYMPVSDYVYAMYRNEFEDQTEVYSHTINPSGPPDPVDPKRIYLPIIIKG
jgi:hypothetical protein